MNLTILLDAKQADDLQRQASARQLSPEELARSLLEDALDRIAEEETWGALNRRRIELINKSRSPGLDAEEAKELARLQAAVDQRLEPVDRQLIAHIEHLKSPSRGA